VLFEGIFLHRPELVDYWDFTIFIDVAFDETLRRAKERDQYLFGGSDDVEAIYKSRYIPGQMLYLESERPKDRARVVLDNSDFANPSILVSR
jgi:uridine kinase